MIPSITKILFLYNPTAFPYPLTYPNVQMFQNPLPIDDRDGYNKSSSPYLVMFPEDTRILLRYTLGFFIVYIKQSHFHLKNFVSGITVQLITTKRDIGAVQSIRFIIRIQTLCRYDLIFIYTDVVVIYVSILMFVIHEIKIFWFCHCATQCQVI